MQPLQDLSRSQRRNIEAGTTSRNQQQKQTGLSCEEDTQALLASSQKLVRVEGLQGRELVQESAISPSAEILQPEQISALYQQCIKLATENKITSKNTWALGLIDHLHDLVQPNDLEGNTTNFQRASVTLGAGVEIYAKRVDSVHTEAYKVMGGLTRSGAAALMDEGDPQEDGETEDPEAAARDQAKTLRRAAMLRDVNPSSTLEPSFEALNVKKFDIAFTVDPLFHKTSAQFDEGGAKGLLLNNLSVYQGCEIFFASHKVPSVTAVSSPADLADVAVDLSAISGYVGSAVEAINRDAVICPALEELYGLLESGNGRQEETDIAQLMERLPDMQRPNFDSGARASHHNNDEQVDVATQADDLSEQDFPNSQQTAPEDIPESGPTGSAEEGHNGLQPEWMTQEQFESQQEMDLDSPAQSQAGDELTGWSPEGDHDETDSYGIDSSQQQRQGNDGQDAVSWLIDGMENLSLVGKAWAGASHWRFRTQRNPNADPELADAPAKAQSKGSSRKRGEPLDFSNLPELAPDALALADPKDITLKTWGTKAPTLLPEDLHYKASSLAELFLLPGVPILERRARTQQSAVLQSDAGYADDGEAAGMWGEDADGADGLDEGSSAWAQDSVLGDLIEAPRKVAQIGINYARASKQVDVRALKQTLWHTIGEVHDSEASSESGKETSFQEVLSNITEENVADNVSDLSVHLCFICVLHLANENGLEITGTPTLDSLTISNIPQSSTV